MTTKSTELRDVHISDEIQRNSALLDRVNDANRVLADVLGQSGQIARADWRLDYHNSDPGLPEVVVRLSDPWGAAEARFTVPQLSQSKSLWNRLYRLWGDVLSNAYDRNMQEFRDAVNQLSES